MRHLHVICGHGAGDSGAVGNGYTEAERVRALGRRIKERGGDNVTLEDTSRNWYADGGLNTINIPSGHAAVELHMDSGPSSAKGGHVIIKQGYSADDADNKLAASMKRIFPGRSNSIVGRSDLANVNRAAKRGINYRLVENGFISNAGDVATFNSKLDEIADAYLDAFGIPVGGTPAPTPKPEPARPEKGHPIMSVGGDKVYRLYNPYSHEHMLTTAASERANLIKSGWTDEGMAFSSEVDVPIYRLYNQWSKQHFFTASLDEANKLIDAGWTYEGIAMFGAKDGAPVYRLVNGEQHLWTADANERDALVKGGWKSEGVGWNAPK